MPEEPPSTAKISAEIAGGSFSPESLSFEMSVGSFPTVSVAVAETSDKPSVSVPVSADILARIGQLQRERLAGRTEPDFSVTADDGVGNSITFRGFVSAPVLDLTEVSTSDKFSAVGEASLLDALDLSIYSARVNASREETESDLPLVPEANDGNVTGSIESITEYLVDGYDTKVSKELPEVEKKLLEMQHSINQNGPLDIWNLILEGSDVVYESWPKAFDNSSTFSRNILAKMKVAMTTKTPGYWNTVRSLMAAFQMYYVPSFEGVGYFKRADTKVGEPEGTIDASVSSISVADGSPRLLQPGGVVMTALGGATGRTETSGTIPQIVAFAPDPLIQGFIQREPAPFWLLSGGDNPRLAVDTEVNRESAAAGGVDLNLDRRKKDKETVSKELDKIRVSSEGIMSELCEVMFKEIQLAHSTVTLRLPLDFSVNQYIGKRVTIALGGGGEFTAFINGLNHQVSLAQGKQMSSGTTLRLTHAEYP